MSSAFRAFSAARPWCMVGAALAVAVSALAATVAVAVLKGGQDVQLAARSQAPGVVQGVGPVETEMRVLQDNAWIESLQTGRYFRERRRARGDARSAAVGNRWDLNQRSRLGVIQPEPRESAPRPVIRSAPQSSETYRTVCVRLCDGYYFPISASTTPGRFDTDARACQSSCAAPTRLYYHRAAGDASEMQDRRGRKYIQLQTAFLYRTEHNAACKCRPDPWEKQARDQHRIYALTEERRKIRRKGRQARETRRALAQEIKSLESGIRRAERQERQEQRKVTDTALADATQDDRDARVDHFVADASESDSAKRSTR